MCQDPAYLGVLSGEQDGPPPSLTTQSSELTVLERGGGWRESSLVAWRSRGSQVAIGLPWVGEVSQFTLPGHWCPSSLGGPAGGGPQLAAEELEWGSQGHV